VQSVGLTLPLAETVVEVPLEVQINRRPENPAPRNLGWSRRGQ
jgi:hypothetical protein